ncbi:MAG: hypothetical protein PHQ23_03835 [Candidatus Wallbacteria bacterium]|nr:hypothetical protein [Candidatus Wallbacteria bacterium]
MRPLLLATILFLINLNAQETAFLPGMYVSSLCCDPKMDETWAGSFDGVYFFSGDEQRGHLSGPLFAGEENQLKVLSGGDLSSRFVTALALDEKYCYAGTDRSLDIVDRFSRKIVKKVPTSQVTSFLRLGHYIMFGTFDGLFFLDDQLNSRPISDLKEGLAFLDQEPTGALHFHESVRTIWIAPLRGGVIRVARNEHTKYLGNVKIRAISSYGDTTCFLAEDSLLLFNGFSWQRMRAKPFGSLPSSRVFSILGFRDSLFISSDTGAFRFDGVFFNPLHDEETLEHKFVRCFATDGHMLYMGTQRDGILSQKIQ